MTGLVLKLAPGERVLVNGAVLENGDRRARLTLVTPNAHVLRLRDAIHPQEVDTPVKRVAYIAQLAVAGEADAEESRRQIMIGIDQLSAVFTDAASVELLDLAAASAIGGKFYAALRALRGLLPREAALLGRSATEAPAAREAAATETATAAP
ncbi:MAG: flagellar biosynthesis repressor FlbT [Rhodobacteraceae bacterium]|nr:MAG: flagellar biosynthesis repressor FlbT [Paracoccaceae bacterium]